MAKSSGLNAPPTSAPDLSILGDTVSLHPAGFDATSPPPPSATTHSSSLPSPDQNLVEGMARFRASPLDFLRELSSHVSGSGWRSYDKIVGQPIYYAGFTETMKSRVMAVPMLRAKIAELATKRAEVEEREGRFGQGESEGESDEEDVKMKSAAEKRARRRRLRRERRRREIEDQLRDVVESMTDNMICKMESKRFIRGAYYLATQLLTRAYHQGIHVSSEEVLRLRAVAEKAEKDKHSIIFLPCHRSHVDYVSLQLICYRLGLALPTVVAGDNLNFPLVGSFLQHAGAMWIRRSFGDDQLYTTLVQSYMDTLLTYGYNFECFIEGGRSRTGKLLPPKFGILRFLLDSVLSGRVDDAIICPVSTQYDKVIEVDSYISELLGQPKAKENLRDFLSASSVLSLKLGRVDVRFHEPWSLRGFIDQQRARYQQLPYQLDAPDFEKEFKLRLLRTLGYRVLSEINAVSVVMPTALVGTVLLTLRGRGVGKSELVRRVDWLSQRVQSQGGRVAHFGGLPTETVVERALDVLGPELVGLVPGLPEYTYYAVDRFQLSFYRNMTIHLFILQSLVSVGMYIRIKQGGGPENQRISHQELYDYVSFLSQLFRGEFIFPTEGMAANLEKTLRGLEMDNVVRVIRSASDLAHIDYVELAPMEREYGRENYDFYCFLLWPFVEASWLGAVSLMMLTPPASSSSSSSTEEKDNDDSPWFDQKKAQDRAQLLGKTLYHQGDLSYFEAVNKETLKNAYTRFEDEGILQVARSRDARIPTAIRLAPDWRPQRDLATGRLLADGKLWAFAERISQSRREGKNRRDGATVRSRVLSLVDLVGAPLFDEAVLPPAVAQAGELDPLDVLEKSVGALSKEGKGQGGMKRTPRPRARL
ncbi:glycerol-3-phosphate acyltransferase-like protein [Phyllosticta citricarpa]|uniref:Glycerol-3-phosphate acyltransferase-like protein n=2 Tax=Phyllosticta TaxID=121621 RepID=A0ABR1M6C0_9PEZI